MLNLNLINSWLWPEAGGPKVFSWFHFVWLGVLVISCFLVIYFYARKHDDKLDEKVIFISGALLIIFEILKQIFKYQTQGYYDWDDFPLQFCSVPMYFAVIIPLVKNKKHKEIIYKFLASFGLIGGLAVMIYPESVFNTQSIVMLIHTMIWHILIVLMGIYLIISRRYGKSLKELLSPFILFTIVVLIAVIINFLAYKLHFGKENIMIKGDFNLFYISPYYGNPIPILGDIKKAVSFPTFIFIYLLVFLIGAIVIWMFVYVIRKILNLRLKKYNY